jgi:hypothetical protein
MRTTYNEIVYMILDELKLRSDDSPFNRDHVVFLMNNFRALLLKQRYGDMRKDIPLANYQSIRVALSFESRLRGNTVLVSVSRVPELVNLNGFESLDIHPLGDFVGNIFFSLVSDERFKVAGSGKYKLPFAYFALCKDGHLRVRSCSPDLDYLRVVQLDGLFEDPVSAMGLLVDAGGVACPDLYETAYPLESNLVPLLIQQVVQELGKVLYIPSDTENNAADDLSGSAASREQGRARRDGDNDNRSIQ